MVELRFKRKYGAVADVKELEYVIALLQTTTAAVKQAAEVAAAKTSSSSSSSREAIDDDLHKSTFNNATICSLDIKRLLVSRYGLSISQQESIRIVQDFSGGYDDEFLKHQDRHNDTLKAIKMSPKERIQQFLHKTRTQLDDSSQNKKRTANRSINNNNSSTNENDQNNSKNHSHFHKVTHALKNIHHMKGNNKNSNNNSTYDSLLATTTMTTAAQLDQIVELEDNNNDNSNHDDILGNENKQIHATDRYADHDLNNNQDNLNDITIDNDFFDTPNNGTDNNNDMNTSIMNNGTKKNNLSVHYADGVIVGNNNNKKEQYPRTDPIEIKKKNKIPLLTGGKDDDHDFERYLDMVEVFSLILIPTIARYTYEWKNGTCSPPVIEPPQAHGLGYYMKYYIYRFRCWYAAYQYEEKYAAYGLPRRFFEKDVRALILLQYKNGRHHDLTGSTTTTTSSIFGSITDAQPPVVTKDFVRTLLNQLGEYEHAANEDLINEMVQVAQSKSGTFDEEAFINAISSDLEDFPTNIEADPLDLRETTFFEDVFHESDPQNVTNLRSDDFDDDYEDEKPNNPANTTIDQGIINCFNGHVQGDNLKGSKKGSVIGTIMNGPETSQDDSDPPTQGDVDAKDKKEKKVKSPFRAELFNIDLVIDSHGSLLVVVIIWMFYMLCVTIYGSLILALPAGETCNPERSQFACMIGSTIASWLGLALFLSLFGVLFITPLSFGNSANSLQPTRQLIASIVALLFAFVPFIIVYKFKDAGRDDGQSEATQKMNSPVFHGTQVLALIVGFALTGYLELRSVLNMLYICLGRNRRFHWLNHLSISSNTRAESRIKFASVYKTNTMLQNALALHKKNLDQSRMATSSLAQKSMEAYLDSPMRNYVIKGEREETFGGFLPIWRLILSGHLFTREGVWIHTRLIVMQFAQIVIGFFVSVILFRIVPILADGADQAREELISKNVPMDYVDIIPTSAMITTSFYPAAVVALLVGILLIGIYVPSVVGTILKFRCQLIPSMGNPRFELLKSRADQVYMNAANGIWGLLGSAVLFYLLIGLTILLFQWPKSQQLMIILLGWGIGLTVTISLKVILTKTCNAAQFRSFFRVKPLSASFTCLALECWYIGVGGSLLIGRITQFLLAACFWVGRTDVSFLSEDVNLGGYCFDYVPMDFLKDVLVHDAHRHPFIERLTQIYLMKIRYSRFGSRACCVWRHIIVLTLMPWLTKYRVFREDRLSQAMHVHAVLNEEEEKDAKGLGTDMKENINTMGDAAVGFTTDVKGTGTKAFITVAHAGTKVADGISNAVVTTVGSGSQDDNK